MTNEEKVAKLDRFFASVKGKRVTDEITLIAEHGLEQEPSHLVAKVLDLSNIVLTCHAEYVSTGSLISVYDMQNLRDEGQTLLCHLATV